MEGEPAQILPKGVQSDRLGYEEEHRNSWSEEVEVRWLRRERGCYEPTFIRPARPEANGEGQTSE